MTRTIIRPGIRAGALAYLVLSAYGAGSAGAALQSSDRGPVELDPKPAADVTRVITQYQDAYAVTSRAPTGDLQATLFSPAGEELGSLALDAAERRLRLAGFGSREESSTFDLTGSAPPADWANAQLYSAWHDARTEVHEKSLGLVRWAWQDGFLRLRSSVLGEAPSAEDRRSFLNQRTTAVTTRFGTLEATSLRQDLSVMPASLGKGSGHPATFSTRLIDQRSGKPLGLARWFEGRRIFSWNLPGRSQGFGTEDLDGKPFPPKLDMAWANLQTYALHQATSSKPRRRAWPGLGEPAVDRVSTAKTEGDCRFVLLEAWDSGGAWPAVVLEPAHLELAAPGSTSGFRSVAEGAFEQLANRNLAGIR
ncbi:MAG: hypothetical protein AAF657_20450 [Acidobacteriota bacterium]